MKKIVKIGVLAVLTGSVIALLAFVNRMPQKVSCNKVSVKIDYSDERYFVTEEEILDIVEHYCDSTGENTLDEGVKLRELEMKVMSHDAVKKCEIYTKVNGSMSVEVMQRAPIGRLINSKGDSFYMDQDGRLMPVMEGRPARVVIVNGNIRESYSPEPYYLNNDSAAKISVLDEVFAVLGFIEKNAFWKAQIEQIYVNENKEFILVPKVGMHEVLFGTAENVAGKFNKLEQFYRKGLTAQGWRNYKTVDVRYKGQVICKGPEVLIGLPADMTGNDTVNLNITNQ